MAQPLVANPQVPVATTAQAHRLMAHAIGVRYAGWARAQAWDLGVSYDMFAHYGIAIRGPEPARLHVNTDELELRDWTLANLNGDWRRWGRAGEDCSRSRTSTPAAAVRCLGSARRSAAALPDHDRPDRK